MSQLQEFLQWSGWSAVGAAAAVATLVVTLIIWMAPRWEREIDQQLDNDFDRIRIKSELRSPFNIDQYKITLNRLNNDLDQHLGPLIGWRSLDACLLISFSYPAFFFLLGWLFGGPSRIGNLYLFDQVNVGERLAIIFICVISSVIVFFILSVYLIESKSYRARSRRVLILSGVLGLVLIIGVLLGGGPGLIAVSGSMAILIIGLYLGDGAGIGALIGAFTITLFGCFAIAGIDSLNKYPGSGAGAMAILAAAGVGGGFLFSVTNTLRETAAVSATVFIVIIILTGLAYGFSGMETHYSVALVLVFFCLLPMANATMDFISLTVTRFFLRRLEVVRGGYLGASIIVFDVVADIFAAIICLILLSIFLTNAIAISDAIFGVMGFGKIPLERIMSDTARQPWSVGFAVAAMLSTTLFPTAIHLAYAWVGIIYSMLPRSREMAALIPDQGMSWKSARGRQAVLRYLIGRRIVHFPTVALSLVTLGSVVILVFIVLRRMGFDLIYVAAWSASWRR